MPAKADPGEQAAFLRDKLQPRLRQAQRGQRTVLFTDAAHFVFGPFLGYLWCLVRLFVPGPSGRKRYNVLAALDAISHRVIRVSNHAYINACSVCDLLRHIAAAGLPCPVTLVLDNARYQRCRVVQALARSLRIELLYLPSYSQLEPDRTGVEVRQEAVPGRTGVVRLRGVHRRHRRLSRHTFHDTQGPDGYLADPGVPDV